MDGDLKLALRLLQWAQPNETSQENHFNKTSVKTWNFQAA
jgi:hypothetical protein